ncbi:MAG: MFS transporter [Bryobacteraceae bacterium]
MNRHAILALLVPLSIITFLDRICISVAGPRMQSELGLSPERWGWVTGAFVLSYGLFEIPTGVMGDRWGQRKVLARIVGWWSAFTALTGAMSSFLPLVITRFLFGMGEAGAFPNMAGVVARWFPRNEHARAQGFIWGASRAGGAIAPLLVVPIQQAFGWRAAFWIFGAVGVVWCAVWLAIYRDKTSERPANSHSVDWSMALRNRQLWIILGMYSCQAWASWFYFSWMHTFLVKGRGFSEGQMAAASALPFLLSAAATVGGGFLSEIACRRFGSNRGRVLIGTCALSASAAMLAATALTTGKIAVVVFLACGFGVLDVMLPSAWSLCIELGGEHAGAATGAMNSAGQLGGFLCTVIFGYLVTALESYDKPLFAIVTMLLIGSFLFSRIDVSKPLLGASR